MKTDAEIREELAPRVARLILNRQGPQGVSAKDAEELAHQILTMAGAAFLAQRSTLL